MIRIKKSALICFALLASTFYAVAQQDAQYSQYMFNSLVINPAYAGSKEVTNANVLYRTQWVGLDNFGLYYLGARLPSAPEEIKDPHNVFVKFLVELGVVGLVFCMAGGLAGTGAGGYPAPALLPTTSSSLLFSSLLFS